MGTGQGTRLGLGGAHGPSFHPNGPPFGRSGAGQDSGPLQGETRGLPNGMRFRNPGLLGAVIPDFPQCEFGSCMPGVGEGFADPFDLGLVSHLRNDCFYSGLGSARDAMINFDLGRETRLVRSMSRGAAQGFAMANTTGKVTMLIPFVGPYLTVETQPELTLAGAAFGAGRAYVNTSALEPVRRSFVGLRALVGGFSQCISGE